jgi:3-methylcrotonyl-CoA carboxylase alpha subunit
MRKVLIANRGEIACRIVRSCRALGLRTVAVHSEADAGGLHVALADEAQAIGPAKAAESYLKVERILEAARAARADAIHPGYGFLAENASFAHTVSEAGMIWIGPDPRTIEAMGDKERARVIAEAAGVPVLPGSPRFGPDEAALLEDHAAEIGFPLIVKAAAGGGGIGMKRVETKERLADEVGATQAMADKAFGDGTVYLEKYLSTARHIEIQVFGFGDRHAIHLFERECSIQRRFQKIVEEAPAPGLSEATRSAMAEAAVALARETRYRSAGTVEFVVGPDEAFYFLEMNTRIQVEHPVTEMVTGLDLVAMQIRLARGDDLVSELPQERVRTEGHAIECRIYAEKPEMKFLPSPGTVTRFEPPAGTERLRIDAGVHSGDAVTFHYDPLIAKVIAHGPDRVRALEHLAAALEGFRVEGVATNIGFLHKLVTHPRFRDGAVGTGFVDAHLADLIGC